MRRLLNNPMLKTNDEVEQQCCDRYNGTLDITNSCIFCKTYIKRINSFVKSGARQNILDLLKQAREASRLDTLTRVSEHIPRNEEVTKHNREYAMGYNNALEQIRAILSTLK